MSPLRNQIAIEIRVARQRLGFSQEQLAEAVDASVESISNFERGKTTPGLEIFARLAQQLRLDVAALLAVELPATGGADPSRIAIEAEARALAERLPTQSLQTWIAIGKVLAEQAKTR